MVHEFSPNSSRLKLLIFLNPPLPRSDPDQVSRLVQISLRRFAYNYKRRGTKVRFPSFKKLSRAPGQRDSPAQRYADRVTCIGTQAQGHADKDSRARTQGQGHKDRNARLAPACFSEHHDT